jgi:hypothetical protein
MRVIQREIERSIQRSLYESVPDAMSGGVVSMGTFPLDALSSPEFKCTEVVPIPGFSGKLNVVVMPNEKRTITTFAVPESYNLDGQLDALLAEFQRRFGAERVTETAAAV